MGISERPTWKERAEENWKLYQETVFQLNAAKEQRDNALIQNRELAEALLHMKSCGPCGEESWETCEGGRAALEVLRKIENRNHTPAKSECDHEWAHIEDYRYFCPKCRLAADRCPTCGCPKPTTCNCPDCKAKE